MDILPFSDEILPVPSNESMESAMHGDAGYAFWIGAWSPISIPALEFAQLRFGVRTLVKRIGFYWISYGYPMDAS